MTLCPDEPGLLTGTHSLDTYPYLTPDLTTLVIRSSGEVSRYVWPDLTAIDELVISGGNQIGVTNSVVYVHVGFNVRSYPLGSTTPTNIGTTIGGGGLGQPILLAGDGFLYLLEDRVAGPRLWKFSTGGPSSQPGTIVATLADFNLANRDFYGDGDDIWISMRHDTSGDWHLIHYDVSSTVTTDLGVLPAPTTVKNLAGVLHDGTLSGWDASNQLIHITPDVGGATYTTEALCPSMLQGLPMNTIRQGSIAVGILDDFDDFHVYLWPGTPPPPPQRQPDPRPAFADDSCILGCPETRIYAMDFCGAQTICDLTEHVTFAKWGRELDDDSEVEITVHLTGDASGAACCECIEKLRTWRNEIMIVRGGEIVWGPGPIVTIGVQRQLVHLVARDIIAWLDVRLVHNAYNFVQVDLATIAETIIEDALTEGAAADLPADVRDACILDFATFTETGKLRDLEILANRRSAGEVLRELATQGLDFTVVNRALYVGADFQFGPIGPLFDDAFQEDLLVAERGLSAASKWWVSSDTTQGSCGGVSEFFGLIERGVEGQPAATSVQDMTDEACDRLRGSYPPPLIVTVPSEGQLSQIAPVCPKQLIPGTLVDLSIGELCRPATVRERLTSVRFTIDEHGEHPGITLAPMGEVTPTEEAAE